MTPEQRDRNRIVYLAILVEGGLIVVATVLGWLVGQPPLTRFALEEDGLLLGFLGAVPMVGLFLGLRQWPVAWLADIDRFTDQVIIPLLRPCSVLDLLGIACLAGLGEEMLFRGVLQDLFREYLPLWAAIAIAGLLFGLLHAVTFSYIVLAAVMGMYLGWLYEVTGNLLAPIVTHAAYDFVVLLLMVQPESEDEEEEAPDDDEEDNDDDEERTQDRPPLG
ncbi:MAG: CPBP family intramembrane glutamic endopeptidase [Gemmataceae bacterium]